MTRFVSENIIFDAIVYTPADTAHTTQPQKWTLNTTASKIYLYMYNVQCMYIVYASNNPLDETRIHTNPHTHKFTNTIAFDANSN